MSRRPAVEGLDDATLAHARECAALVEKAEGRSMPPGLGPPDAGWLGFDWRVFRPRGPYVGEVSRERAFRATRWLQSVPFRLERDEEVAALWLARQARDSYWPSPMWANGLVPLTESSIFADAFAPANEEFGPRQLGELRAALRRGLAGRGHTDLLHGTPRAAEVRLAPSVRLPEDPIFFALLHPEGRLPGVGFPLGLTVASALGSPLAPEVLPGAMEGSRSLAQGWTWVAAAHAMRAALLDPAEPDAPPLFSSPAWQRKSLRTALGSWALERNVWTLHSGPVMAVFGGPKQVPGLVEPDPGAFAAMSRMGSSVLRWMEVEDEELDGEAMRLEYAEGVLVFARG
jgi:hypothetical protein